MKSAHSRLGPTWSVQPILRDYPNFSQERRSISVLSNQPSLRQEIDSDVRNITDSDLS